MEKELKQEIETIKLNLEIWNNTKKILKNNPKRTEFLSMIGLKTIDELKTKINNAKKELKQKEKNEI